MYVTRPLSHYQKSPESLKVPPEGPNSGFLVLQDVEIERYTCFGLCKCSYLEDLPFPQDKQLERFNVEDGRDPILLIPVLGQPLSSNRYYAIKPDGYQKGEAFTCSRERDMVIWCFSRWVRDVRPKPLDPRNIYQQFEISLCGGKGSFGANSVAPDGVPPYFLTAQGWNIFAKTSESYRLGKASGLNVSLRKRLPELNFPPSSTSSEAVIVGKWYCPFVFIKDGALEDQMERSVFYEMTLEQRWEQIFTCQNDRNEGISSSTVLVDTVLEREEVLISGSKAKWVEKIVENGVIWFKPFNAETEEPSVGLRQEIVEQMKWEQERGGWSGGEKELKVNMWFG